MTSRPRFFELSTEECRALLGRLTHGHLAFTFRDRVDIEPMHYVLDGDWIYMRTAPGTKLTTLTHHPWVVFQVDEVVGLFDWQSVTARGTVYMIDPDDGPQGTARYAEAVRALQRLVPTAFTPDDPVAGRDVILRIHVDEVQGRAARSA